ncbi:hypothetical protein DSO57_1030895 [Entomophthora muscae]|uniref:Uncharacterized protein n=1 Tax=Entomophthora muscae TaxID=34485 RepID=A0ACC2UAZ8_9FUNG|nr:hypothetical protein DSO57_1030895 [Entomophthora muscae]
MEPPVTPKPMPASAAELPLDHTNKLFGIIYITLTGVINTIVPAAGPWLWLGKSISYLIKLAPILWWALPTQSATCQFPDASKPASQGWFPDNDVPICGLDTNNLSSNAYTMTESQSLASKTVVEASKAMHHKARAAPKAAKIPVGSDILVFNHSVAQSMSKKFLPKWSSPYCVIGPASSGNYYLADQDGQKLNYVINGNQLKLFHCPNEEGENVV